MRTVVWSDDALHDFRLAIAHIAGESEQAATLVADRVETAAALLAKTPIGHPGRVAGTFEKRVLRTPYILAYALSDQSLTIVRVIHGSREWLDDAWPSDDG